MSRLGFCFALVAWLSRANLPTDTFSSDIDAVEIGVIAAQRKNEILDASIVFNQTLAMRLHHRILEDFSNTNRDSNLTSHAFLDILERQALKDEHESIYETIEMPQEHTGEQPVVSPETNAEDVEAMKDTISVPNDVHQSAEGLDESIQTKDERVERMKPIRTLSEVDQRAGVEDETPKEQDEAVEPLKDALEVSRDVDQRTEGLEESIQRKDEPIEPLKDSMLTLGEVGQRAGEPGETPQGKDEVAEPFKVVGVVFSDAGQGSGVLDEAHEAKNETVEALNKAISVPSDVAIKAGRVDESLESRDHVLEQLKDALEVSSDVDQRAEGLDESIQRKDEPVEPLKEALATFGKIDRSLEGKEQTVEPLQQGPLQEAVGATSGANQVAGETGGSLERKNESVEPLNQVIVALGEVDQRAGASDEAAKKKYEGVGLGDVDQGSEELDEAPKKQEQTIEPLTETSAGLDRSLAVDGVAAESLMDATEVASGVDRADEYVEKNDVVNEEAFGPAVFGDNNNGALNGAPNVSQMDHSDENRGDELNEDSNLDLFTVDERVLSNDNISVLEVMGDFGKHSFVVDDSATFKDPEVDRVNEPDSLDNLAEIFNEREEVGANDLDHEAKLAVDEDDAFLKTEPREDFVVPPDMPKDFDDGGIAASAEAQNERKAENEMELVGKGAQVPKDVDMLPPSLKSEALRGAFIASQSKKNDILPRIVSSAMWGLLTVGVAVGAIVCAWSIFRSSHSRQEELEYLNVDRFSGRKGVFSHGNRRKYSD